VGQSFSLNPKCSTQSPNAAATSLPSPVPQTKDSMNVKRRNFQQHTDQLIIKNEAMLKSIRDQIFNTPSEKKPPKKKSRSKSNPNCTVNLPSMKTSPITSPVMSCTINRPALHTPNSITTSSTKPQSSNVPWNNESSSSDTTKHLHHQGRRILPKSHYQVKRILPKSKSSIPRQIDPLTLFHPTTFGTPLVASNPSIVSIPHTSVVSSRLQYKISTITSPGQFTASKPKPSIKLSQYVSKVMQNPVTVSAQRNQTSSETMSALLSKPEGDANISTKVDELSQLLRERQQQSNKQRKTTDSRTLLSKIKELTYLLKQNEKKTNATSGRYGFVLFPCNLSFV